MSYSVTSVAGDPSLVVTGLGTSLTIEGNTNRASITITPVDDAVQQLIDNGDVEFDITLTAKRFLSDYLMVAPQLLTE